MDFLGEYGDPIYAAGYRIAYVGATEAGCRESQEERRGTWVWVDHGVARSPGTTTRQAQCEQRPTRHPGHQDRRDGIQRSAATVRCPVPHFERRVTNMTSQRVAPPPMWACHKGQAVSYPGGATAVGMSPSSRPTNSVPGPRAPRAWRVRVAPVRRPWEPRRRRMGTTASRCPGRLRRRIPALVRGYRISVALWHPRTSDWSDAWHYTAPAASRRFTIPKLDFRRTYRVKVAARDGAGYSPWSANRDVVVADPPDNPKFVKVEGSRRSVRAVWRFPGNGGNRITRYEATISRKDVPVSSVRISSRQRKFTWEKFRNVPDIRSRWWPSTRSDAALRAFAK